MALEKFESKLERLFEGSFTRAFRHALQPIEIGQRIVREVDLSRRVAPSGLLAPNHLKVWLSPKDAQRFEGFQKALVAELVETIRGHALTEGYNFVGPVAVEIFIDDDLGAGEVAVKSSFVGGESEPRIIDSLGSVYPIGKEPLIIGRANDCDVIVADKNVSRRHAEVWRTSEGVAIKDLGSTNGTIVNGHRITAVSLSPRDEVLVGPLRFRIELA
ncbi:MAG: DUF3662 and FHA domain-containing protein [Actinomycetota bacterium]|jgi:hypothetical protein